MLKIAVLISGRGSNLQALIDAVKEPGFPAEIVTVISNKLDVYGLQRAESAKIPTQVINHIGYENRQKYDEQLDKALVEKNVQLVCLAGFMRILTPWFVDRWRDRLINIHPSFLPAFPGLNTHAAALKAGVKSHGCTVHFVRAELDHGPIIKQAAVPVLSGDTEETLAARVLEEEHKIYPEVVRLIAENRVNVYEEKVFITGEVAPEEVALNLKLAKSGQKP